jgi:pantoate--beta-alanine ligase
MVDLFAFCYSIRIKNKIQFRFYMLLFKNTADLKNHLGQKKNKIIGFVPTMGALHAGHISLIFLAKKECDIVVSSIFVNPTQFNDINDLINYPRTFEKDFAMLQDAECDVLFAPEIQEMYSEEELLLKKQNIEDRGWTQGKNINFGSLEKVMEGAFRPGHFNGVAQVVSKLFNAVQPHKAYFGEKDFQQLAIIRSMVKQMELPIEIIGCPIVRENNGLAMSSRNERLTKTEREKAALISQTLFEVQRLYKQKTVGELKELVEKKIKTEPLMRLEYFEIASVDTLTPISQTKITQEAIACIAVYVGSVRLIDNVKMS